MASAVKVLFEMMIKYEFRANGYKCGDCFGNQPTSFLLVTDGVWVDMSSELDSGLGIFGHPKVVMEGYLWGFLWILFFSERSSFLSSFFVAGGS